MIGGISCPPVEDAASTPPAKRPRKPLDFMSGMVITPVEAVLATADPVSYTHLTLPTTPYV